MGQEYYPALSPDGQTLVYASRASGNWDLWMKTVGTREVVNLTADNASDDLQPAFAPDGQRLAFRSERAGGGLFVMDVATRAVKKICDTGFNPTWSPPDYADGEEIAYGTASILQIEARPRSEIWAVNLRTGKKRLIVEQDAAQPSWSPLGKRLAFWRTFAEGKMDLMTVAASGGAPVRVTDDAASDWNPVWSADGKHLFFLSNRSGSQNLWRLAVDETTGQVNGPLEPATTPATSMLHLCVARAGRQLAYVHRRGVNRIQSMPFDPVNGKLYGEPRTLTRGTSSSTHPRVSPDGQWLVYTSYGNSQEDLYLMRTDGSDVRQLTNDTAKDQLPRWSADGQRLVVQSDRAGKHEAWAMQLNTPGKFEQLTFTNNERVVWPNFSPDGNQLAYAVLGKGTFVFDLHKPWEQQTPQPLSFDGQAQTGLAVWAWSPDGKKLACYKFYPGTKKSDIVIYTFATADTPVRPVQMDTVPAGDDYPTWLSDSQRLITAQAGQLYFVDLRTKAARPLYQFPANEAAEYLTLAPDDRTLYFTHVSSEADIWLLKQ